jgi:uncharacterized membrane protein YfcA
MLDDRRSQQWKALLPTIIFLLIIVGLLLWYYWYGYAHFAFNGVSDVSPGLLGGLVGLGGGYALIPGLIYIFGAPAYITMGISLATMILLASVGGAIKIAQGSVDIGPALLLWSGAIAGAQIGAAIIKRFKPSTLKLILRSTSLTVRSSSFSLTSEF